MDINKTICICVLLVTVVTSFVATEALKAFKYKVELESKGQLDAHKVNQHLVMMEKYVRDIHRQIELQRLSKNP